MYQQDSFFDLSPLGQLGLAGLSVLLAFVALWIVHLALRRRSAGVRVVGALGLFWIFVWVSPQVYYQYFHLLFDSLPRQWVIWPPEAPQTALRLLIFQGPQTLSAHGQGILGWCLIAVPWLRWPVR